MTKAGYRGFGGMDGEGLLGVWDTTDSGYFVQVPGENVVFLQQKLAGGGIEPLESAGKMGTAGEAFGKGGSG